MNNRNEIKERRAARKEQQQKLFMRDKNNLSSIMTPNLIRRAGFFFLNPSNDNESLDSKYLPPGKRTKLTTFDSLMHIYIPYNLAATRRITIYSSKI